MYKYTFYYALSNNKYPSSHIKILYKYQVHTLQLMVEQQHRVVDELKSQLARNNSKKTRTRLEAAVSQLAELEAQVLGLQKLNDFFHFMIAGEPIARAKQ